MEIRWLRFDEYHKLDSIPNHDSVSLNPDNSLVVVAVKDEEIIGRMVIINLPHIECAWVAPEHRGGILASSLEKACINRLKELGASKMLAIAINEEIESYFDRRGYKKLGTVWIKEI
jgi:N-acetylglutamate synthase-like GNAT family acetyltransferase